MNKRNKKTLLNKQPLYILSGIITVLLIAGGYIYYRYDAAQLIKGKENDLKAIAALKTDQIENWLNERYADAKVLSQSQMLIETVNSWIKNKTNTKLQEDILNQLALPQEEYNYESIFLSLPNGEILLSVGSSLHLFDNHTKKFVFESYNNREILFTDFYYCNLENKVHFDIMAPIFKGNEVVAILVFRRDPDRFIYPLIQSWPLPDKTAETLLIKRDGDSVLFLNELRHQKNTALKLHLPLNKDLPAAQAIAGKTGVFYGKDYRGIEVLSWLSPVSGTDWYMVAKVDRNEVFKELYIRAGFIIAISIVIILLIATSIAWLYHYRQRNTYRELYQKKIELHESQELFLATLYSIGDGVVTTDKNGFIKYLNPVAEKLTGWSEEEALGKKIDEVFKIINEETRENVENSVDKVLREGMIVGLANHTLLISKKGKEIPIADSGSPIKDKGGNIIGVVMVFRDQSEERAYLNALEESEARFENLFERAPLGYQSLDENGCFIEVNEAWISTLGYTKDEIIGHWFGDFLAPEYVNSFKERFPVFKKKGRVHTEFEMIHKSGERRFIAFDGRIGHKLDGSFEKTHCIINDITEQKQAEEALKKIEWMLQPRQEKEPLEDFVPLYGDLTKLNRGGLIFNSIDQETLKIISADYLSLLETSSAIYEKNGDYALGIFSSGWCRFLDEASYKLCNTKDNHTAMNCGKWHCHESCWTDASKKAIKEGKIVDIECNGALRLYAIPIKANNETIGAINFGYGNPPNHEAKLKELAEKYQVDVGDLKKLALAYEARPPYIIEMAKKRLASTAHLIGALVERTQAEIKLKENLELLKIAGESARFGGWSVNLNDERCTWSDVVTEIHEETHGFSPLVKDGISYYAPEWRKKITEVFTRCTKEGVPYDEEMEIITAKGNRRWVRTIGKAERDDEGNIVRVSGSFQDITDRKNSEIELRKSKEFILTIIENLPIGLAVNSVEPEVKFEFMNENFAKIYGVSKERLSTPDAFWDEVYEDADYREEIKNKVLSDMASNVTERMKWFDIPIKKGGKIVKYINARNIPLKERNLVISTVWDVTEQKRVEESLRKSEERKSKFFEFAPYGIFISDQNGNFIEVNPEATKITGYTRDELLKLNIENFLTPNSKDAGIESFNTVKSKGYANVDLEYKKRNGEVGIWNVVATKLSNNNFIAFCKEITQQYYSEKRILESEQKFRFLAENSVDCIWTLDRKLVFTYLSPALKRMTDFEPEEWVGTKLSKHTTWLEFIKMGRYALKMINNYKSFDYTVFETKMYNKKGELIPLEITGRPYIINNKIIGLQGITRDISERIKAENELKQLNESLELKVLEKTRELNEKIVQLERFKDATIDRELRMKELRDEIKRIKGKA